MDVCDVVDEVDAAVAMVVVVALVDASGTSTAGGNNERNAAETKYCFQSVGHAFKAESRRPCIAEEFAASTLSRLDEEMSARNCCGAEPNNKSCASVSYVASCSDDVDATTNRSDDDNKSNTRIGCLTTTFINTARELQRN